MLLRVFVLMLYSDAVWFFLPMYIEISSRECRTETPKVKQETQPQSWTEVGPVAFLLVCQSKGPLSRIGRAAPKLAAARNRKTCAHHTNTVSHPPLPWRAFQSRPIPLHNRHPLSMSPQKLPLSKPQSYSSFSLEEPWSTLAIEH